MIKEINYYGGILIRSETCDEGTVKALNGSYRSLEMKDKTILDLGGHIGSFARYAVYNGAKKVITVEPEPHNFKMLSMNVANFRNIIPLNRAVVPDDFEGDKTNLWVNSKKSKGMHSLKKRRGRDSVAVNTIKFSKLLEKYRPDSLKIDIEGTEYKILKCKLPSCVKSLVMELHLNDRIWKEKESKILLDDLKAQGFKVDHGRITPKCWHVIVKGRR